LEELKVQVYKNFDKVMENQRAEMAEIETSE
jgi:hypothetical protein